jgi:hypothetical protein
MNMEKIIKKGFLPALAILAAILTLLPGCSVNDSISLLTITNRSGSNIDNIKIGNTLIASSISPGGIYNYYITTELTGKFTANGAVSAGYSTIYDVNRFSIVVRNGTYKLKAGKYFFDSEVFDQNGQRYITLRCEKTSSDWQEDGSDSYITNEFYTE